MATSQREKSIWYALCLFGFFGLLSGRLDILSVTEKKSFPREHLGLLEVPDFIDGETAGYIRSRLRIVQVEPGDKL